MSTNVSPACNMSNQAIDATDTGNRRKLIGKVLHLVTMSYTGAVGHQLMSFIRKHSKTQTHPHTHIQPDWRFVEILFSTHRFLFAFRQSSLLLSTDLTSQFSASVTGVGFSKLVKFVYRFEWGLAKETAPVYWSCIFPVLEYRWMKDGIGSAFYSFFFLWRILFLISLFYSILLHRLVGSSCALPFEWESISGRFHRFWTSSLFGWTLRRYHRRGVDNGKLGNVRLSVRMYRTVFQIQRTDFLFSISPTHARQCVCQDVPNGQHLSNIQK